MKKYHSTFLAIFPLILIIAFSSCAKPSHGNADTYYTPDTDDATQNIDSDINLPDTALDTYEDTEQLSPERVPVENSEAERLLEYQFEIAKKAVYWIINENMPVSEEAPFVDYESGITYYRVNDTATYKEIGGRAIDSVSALEKYLNAIFSKRFADGLMEEVTLHYRDVDGVLYCEKFVSEQRWEMDEAEFFLSRVSPKSFRYTAKVENTEDPETLPDKEPLPQDQEKSYTYYDYIFENNGKDWIWTEFPIF